MVHDEYISTRRMKQKLCWVTHHQHHHQHNAFLYSSVIVWEM